MIKIILTLMLCAIASSHAQTYIGAGIGQGNNSNPTVSDMEWGSLDITQNRTKATSHNLFVGEKINNYLSSEFSYFNLGSRYVSGTDSGATANSKSNLQGVGLSFLASYDVGGFSPYIRIGAAYTKRTENITKSGPTSVFSNPNDNSSANYVIRPVYGLGVDFDLTNKLGLRLDYMVITNAYVDYINNVNNGNIKRDSSSVTANLIYKFGDQKNSQPELGDDSWSVGISGGISQTSAKITPGSYSGNTWNLASGTINSQVSGSMHNDKSSSTYRISVYRDTKDIEYELYAATLGEFSAKSETLGITGGGNAITGATARTANAYGLSAGYKFKLSELALIIPRVGFALVTTRDEIYNNLDFSGVGGSQRGPVVTTNVFTPTAGLTFAYDLFRSTQLRIGYDYYNSTGSNTTLGKGSISTVTAGIKIALH